MPEEYKLSRGYNPTTPEDWERAADFWLAESKSDAAQSDPEYAQLCTEQAIRCATKSAELMVAELMAAAGDELYWLSLYQGDWHALMA